MEKSALRPVIETLKSEAIDYLMAKVDHPPAMQKRQDVLSFVAGMLAVAKDETKTARQVLADLSAAAMAVKKAAFGDRVLVATRVEFSNYCKNDCYYCGRSQTLRDIARFRLIDEDIDTAFRAGADLGYRRFLLHSGEDPSYDDEAICRIISDIKRELFPSDLVLAIGERSTASYRRYYVAGADGYLLPHITANEKHFSKLHPTYMCLSNRMACLEDLRDIGYKVATGIIVGMPYQTPETLTEDVIFMSSFQPHMVSIAPFIPAKKTFFENDPIGDIRDAHVLTALTRLLVPRAIIPAVTTLSPEDKEYGFAYGANALITQLVRSKQNMTYRPHPFTIDIDNNAKAAHKKIVDDINKAGLEPDFGQA